MALPFGLPGSDHLVWNVRKKKSLLDFLLQAMLTALVRLSQEGPEATSIRLTDLFQGNWRKTSCRPEIARHKYKVL